MMHDDPMNEHKRAILMDLLSKMKELQSSSMEGSKKPHAVELEVHEEGAIPLSKEDKMKMDEEDANKDDMNSEDSENHDEEQSDEEDHPEHSFGDEQSPEEESSEQEQENEERPMHPALAALLAEHMKRK